MKKTFLLQAIIYATLTGCSTIGTMGAELSGLSFFHDRRNSEIILKDERIELNASVELNSNEDIRNKTHFNVTSYNGIVLVTGEAPTAELKNKIIDTVRVISGIKLVHNHLRVAEPSSTGSRTTDSLITGKVKTALTKVRNLAGFDATRVKVVTENKTVYLMGLLHRSEGNVATEIARRVDGVEKVVKIFELIP